MESSCSSSCSIAFSPADSSHSTTTQHLSSIQPQHHHAKGANKRGRAAAGLPIPAVVPELQGDSGSATPPPDHLHHADAAAIRKYRGIRMRKWGKWVAEIREPNKRSRIWLGSYSTPVAAARAYDTAVFFLRGRSARLNFPEEIGKEPEAASVMAGSAGGLSAASIRQKAAEVGARVDALHAGVGGVAAAAGTTAGPAVGEHKQQQQRHENSGSRVKKEEDDDDSIDEDVPSAGHLPPPPGRPAASYATPATPWKKPDLNRQPSPECSDDEGEYGVVRAC